LEGLGELPNRPPAGRGQVTLGVVDRAREDVQVVVQPVELVAGHDQFVLAQLEFGSSLPMNPVPLTTSLRTEPPRASRPGAVGEHAPAPSAPRAVSFSPTPLTSVTFRHDGIVGSWGATEADAGRCARSGTLSAVSALPEPPECAFASDNAAPAHPTVIEAIISANEGHALAYGQDAHTAECGDRFRDLFGSDVITRLTFNGTGANVAALATMLGNLRGPHHAIVCTNWSHIEADETGAPERVLGTKLIDLPSPTAKVTPEQLAELSHLQGVPHHVQPGIVSITQSTELGTVYTADEIGVLAEQAHRMGMLVHLDGARIANATAALGGTVAALRSFTIDAGVDVVSFGGTKNGLLGAEAIIFLDPETATGSEYVRKQVTQLPSKMRFLAAQFNAVLDGNLWIDLAAHSNAMALELHRLVGDISGIEVGDKPEVNSLFPTLPTETIEPLRDWCFFWDWDSARRQVRWMTSWDTTTADVERFAAGVRALV
jgi:threonine aldolase